MAEMFQPAKNKLEAKKGVERILLFKRAGTEPGEVAKVVEVNSALIAGSPVEAAREEIGGIYPISRGKAKTGSGALLSFGVEKTQP